MSDKKAQKKKGGNKKIGRSKRSKDVAMSNYVRGKIDFNNYEKKKGAN